MSRLRNRDKPRAEPTQAEKLQRLVSTYRVPEGLSLDAFTSGLSPSDLLEKGRSVPVDHLVEDATNVFLTAFNALRMGSLAQKEAIRGCTIELVALMSGQAVRFASMVGDRKKRDAGRAIELESVQAQHRTLAGKAATLRDQARRVLASMDRDNEDFQAEVERLASPTGDAAESLWSLAGVGRRLLLEASGELAMRARLFGLDLRYLEQLELAADSLRLCEADLARLRDPNTQAQEALLLEAGTTLFFLTHVVEAFASAREIEPSVPALKPVHLARILRRHPPPGAHAAPKPQGRVPKGEPRSPQPAPSEPEVESEGNPFAGGLGRTTMRF